MTNPLSRRDQAVLRAVAAGRCRVTRGAVVSLLVDGVPCCDQFAGHRLVSAGLVAVPVTRSEPARLTEAGAAVVAGRRAGVAGALALSA